ncbi:MAG: GxxExxY protein [Acetobacteraceae bacterium]|jgi:GxxExxY protein
MNSDQLNGSSERIIGCALAVANTLGVGFLQKVYENALAHDLRKIGWPVAQQHPVAVTYDEVIVGSYSADLFVAQPIMVELKTVASLDASHRAQRLNYLADIRRRSEEARSAPT